MNKISMHDDKNCPKIITDENYMHEIVYSRITHEHTCICGEKNHPKGKIFLSCISYHFHA